MNDYTIGAAVLAGLAFLIALFTATRPALGDARPGAMDAQGRVAVRFSFKASGAKSVHVAGTWNGWAPGDPDAALEDSDANGVFEGTVAVPASGRQSYKFVVDGVRWEADPDHARREPNGQGGENSVLELSGAPAEPASGGDPFGSTTVRPNAFTGEVFFLEPGTEKLPDLSKLEPKGKIWTELLDIPSRAFDEGFPGLSERFEWFALRYRGTFEVAQAGEHRFRLISDDGSKLWIDGNLAIDNDGLHEPKEVVQRVRLKKGPHQLQLDYMQGPARHVALRLLVLRPGTTEEEPVRVRPPAPTAGKEGR